MSTMEARALGNVTFDDVDDDDDQFNSLHKINPNIQQTITSKTNQINNSNFDVHHLIKNQLEIYLNTIIPKDYSSFIRCHIKREKEGLTKGFATIFYLYFDGINDDEKTFLLIARKHLTIGGHLEYYIGTNINDPIKNLTEENSIAKLKGINLAATEYILYDRFNSSKTLNQTVAVIYETHIFGGSGPRKMTVLLQNKEKATEPLKENETIIDQWRSGHSNNLLELKNKTPIYVEETKKYVINLCEDRVKQPSHKNFQIVTSDDNHENNVAMEFGRIDENTFALDYRYPLTAIQAFAIALSAFHHRFRT